MVQNTSWGSNFFSPFLLFYTVLNWHNTITLKFHKANLPTLYGDHANTPLFSLSNTKIAPYNTIMQNAIQLAITVWHCGDY